MNELISKPPGPHLAPDEIIIETIYPPGTTRDEIEASLCDLFTGLSNAVRRGYSVNLDDPMRIVVTRR